MQLLLNKGEKALDFKIISEFYNPLLQRKELLVEIIHPNESTPERYSVRKSLALKLNTEINNLYIRKMESKTGMNSTLCEVEIYENEKIAKAILPKHILLRNLPPEQRVKKTEESKAKK
jgi:small subunit ribosomal protein S24e